MAHRSTPESRRAFFVKWFAYATIIFGIALFIAAPFVIGLAIAFGGFSIKLIAIFGGVFASLALGLGLFIATDEDS